MIKSAIIEYFEQPQYIVYVWHYGEVYISCLMVKSGRAEILLGVLTQYIIWGFCRLGLIRLNFFGTKT